MNKQDIDFIKQEHKKYQEIFNVDLPDFDDIIFEGNMGNTLALFIREGGKQILKINEDLPLCHHHYYRAQLYHEFTHQMDHICSPYINDLRMHDAYMKAYSEIHASAIELQTLLNSYGYNHILNENKLVWLFNKQVTCEEFLNSKIDRTEFGKNNIDIGMDDKKCVALVNNVVNVLYCIGYATIFDMVDYLKIINNIFMRVQNAEFKHMFSSIIKAYNKKDIETLVKIYLDFDNKYRMPILMSAILHLKELGRYDQLDERCLNYLKKYN